MVSSSKGFLDLSQRQADTVILSEKMLNILMLKIWFDLMVVLN